MRALVLIAVTACGDNLAAPDWHVADRFVRDPDNRALIMRGVNLSGSQKVAPYLDDKTPADYTRLRADWGFNAIRFVMTWSAVEPQDGVFDDAYLAQVAERLQWAHDAGLYAVLDMHEDIYGEGFGFDGAPRWTCAEDNYAAFVPKDPWFLASGEPVVQACTDALYVELAPRFVAMWAHVAEALKDAPVLGFDVLNEPNWGTYGVAAFEVDRLAPFYTDVVRAVRAVNPSWLAFLEPSASRNVGFASHLPAFELDNVVYSPHLYDANAEAGGGFDSTHRDRLIQTASEYVDEAAVVGGALWIGEYGGQAGTPGIVPYMDADYTAAGNIAASTMYWAYDKSNGYGLLDPDGNEKPDLVGAVVRPYPALVAGTPQSYAFADGVFTLSYTPDRLSPHPTEIIVPARVFPSGYTVSCGACRWHAEGDVVKIDAPGDSTVTISAR